MRAYLENQVESAAAVAFNMDNFNPIDSKPHIRKASSAQFQISPTRSSIRKVSSIGALTKNVKLAEVVEERVIIPKTTKTTTTIMSPVKGLDLSVPIDDLLPATPADQDSAYRPGPPSYGGGSPAIFSSVKNAFSMIAKTLTSPTKPKPNYGAQFDQAMLATSPPTAKPSLPPREPKKYLDIPRERIKSASSVSQTSSFTGISSEVNIRNKFL